jgi:hypothetical protein
MSSWTQSSALIISEIMYDPDGSDTDREWTEVFNDSGTDLNIASYKFFESNVNHGLTLVSGAAAIPPQGYAVIVDNPTKFLADNPGFSGILFDSSFSLSNTGEALAVKDGSGAIKDSLTYIPSLGGQDDGSTLSLISGAWVRGNKTPGAANTPFTGSTSNETSSDTSSKTSSSTTISPITVPANADFYVAIPSTKTVIAGADAEFSARAYTSSKTDITDATFAWTFGDGGSRTGKSVGYHYNYPGVYIVVVEAVYQGMTATEKMKVFVVPPRFTVASFGKGEEGNYVDIQNQGAQDLDISAWKINIDNVSYSLPKNMVIAASSTLRIPGEAIGFASTTIAQYSLVRLLYPNFREVYRYFVPTATAYAGVSTTSLATATPPLPRQVYVPLFKAKVMTSTSTQATSTATSSRNALAKKDTKLVDWFGSLFSKLTH